MSILGKISITIGAIALTVFIGFIDIVTGLLPDMTIFYLIPIIMTTYLLGLQ